MKLKTLKLTNFQGIKDFVFTPDGNNASIYGTNGTGKTTLFNAFTWLLYDKASTGEKGFSPKTKDKNGEDIHYLEHRVDGEFILNDGTVIALAKALKENWVKKRGALVETFSGHTTDYYIDGVPVNKSEFDSRVNELCPADKVQILTQPDYFSSVMHWQDRRKILLDVCGDISEFDVINSKELNKLREYLLKPGSGEHYYTVEEYQKIATVKRKEINQKIEQIPARIDEATKAMPDIAGIDEIAVKAKIAELQEQVDKLETEKANVSVDTATQEMQKQISELELKIMQGRAKHTAEYENSVAEQKRYINELKANIEETKSKIETAIIRARSIGNRLQETKDKRARLTDMYRDIQNTSFDESKTVCPACEQAYPLEKIEELKANFNSYKSNELENVRKKIATQCSKAIIAELEEQFSVATKELSELNQQAIQLQAELQQAQNDLPEFVEYANTDEHKEMSAEISLMQEKIKEGISDITEKKNSIQARIDDIKEVVSAEQHKLLLLTSAKQQQERIKELEAEEKQLNQEYEKICQGIYLCELFTKTKVSLLDKKINSKFKSVKFRLFQEQINGGIKEDCEVLIPTVNGLVTYSSANNAAKINAGLEIIDTLSQHWGISMPVFVDNAESVVQLQPINSQVIRLVVSEADNKLRMEVSNK